LQAKSGKTVAIKQIRRNDIREGNLQNLQREIDLLKKLKHPHIVKYIDFIVSEQHYNIVLEFVENGSMRHLLK
jgi:serine/threonine protein kinase